MGFFDDLGKRVTDAGQKTVQKTKDVTEIARINALISQNESKINDIYCQIGQLYVNIHGKDGETEFKDYVQSIMELKRQIVESRQQLQEIRGTLRCPNCGGEISKGSVFCSLCGTPVEKKLPETETGIVCPKCGSRQTEDALFCPECGTKL